MNHRAPVLDQIDGVVETTRYRNGETGYTVLVATVDGQTQHLVGELAGVVEKGATFSAHGRWTVDPKHGRQFRFEHLELHAPNTTDQIKARLLTYPCVGPATADKIIEQFGARTWEVLDRDIDVLKYIPGLGRKALDKIRDHHARQSGPVAAIRHRLISVGVSQTMAKAIHEAYGERSLAMLDDHPYRVAARIERFGFATAESFARSTGLDPETDDRVDAGVLHALRQARNGGHCCLPPSELTKAAKQVLQIREATIDRGVERLLEYGSLRYEHGMVFLTGMAIVEDRVARRLRAITQAARVVWNVGELPEHLSAGQRSAVSAVARTGVTVLTGGPGTGKSATVGAVMSMAERAGVQVLLCAPTGRAAKRLTEATGVQAATIHRMLRPLTGSKGFHHDEQNPLPTALVIVDEASMVDLDLFDALLAALTPDHRLLLVGDADQLPSVGAGNILADVLDAAANGANIATVRLTQVFRQEHGSTIIENAHRLLHGHAPVSDTGKAGQFYMVAAPTPEATAAKIIEMAALRIPVAFKLDPVAEVQVICPVHRGPAGDIEINRALQHRYGPKSNNPAFFGPNGRKFFVGDRVMQTRNDYERNVFNGDLGTVTTFDDTFVTIDFDGSEQRYKRFDLSAIQLAYAMTIHKSQGGEFPAVIVPVLPSARPMSRNLLYTAITRARGLCVLVGSIAAMRSAATTIPDQRWTRLSQRITTND